MIHQVKRHIVVFMLVPGLTVVSIQVYNSFEVYIVLGTWLKVRRIFTQNVFLVQLQPLLEVIDIFWQFHCLSSRAQGRVSRKSR